MGFFEVEISTMEAHSRPRREAGAPAGAGASGRSSRSSCWSPSSSLFAAPGGSLLELVGENPPAADAFDVRRVEFSPGEIRIRVTNPQREDLTIATVTVDDAIVPFTLDGPATLGRLRSSTIVVPYDWVADDPICVGITSSTGIQTTEDDRGRGRDARRDAKGFLGYAVIGVLVGVVPDRPRPALAPVAAACATRVAGGVHGPDRRPAHVPGCRGARRGARAPGRAPERARRHRPRPARRRRAATSRSRSSRSASAEPARPRAAR